MSRFPFAVLVPLLALPACSPAGNALPAQCEAIAVDPMRELVVTDSTTVGSAHLGFAHVMGAVLAGGGDDAARSWMDAWSAAPGEGGIATDVTGPWAASGGAGLDLSSAPFELIAVSNRIDLSTLGPGRVGELRFVYGLVTGGVRRPLTVIVELQLPPTQTAAQWATAWHELGSLEGDANQAALFAIVDAVLAQPLHGQVRTQDARVTPSILLELDLNDGEPLTCSGLFNEPAANVDPQALSAFVSTHQDAILADAQVLPGWMLAASTTATPHDYALGGISADVADTFASETCSGCHSGQPTLDGTFHISPFRRGVDALSPFLLDPSGAPDELSRRAEVLRGLLCGS